MNNKRKVLWVLGLFCLTGFITVTMGNGCSKEFSTADYSSSSSGSTSSTVASTAPPPANTGINVIPDTKTVSLVYGNQVLDHLSSCLGVAVPSAQTLAVYQEKKGTISLYGMANTVTAPMMMAVTAVGSEVCKDLIEQEKVSQRIFKNYQFDSTSLPSNGLVLDSIARLALSCWQRREVSTEIEVLVNMLNSSIAAGEVQAGEKAALLLCTSMVSSLDALLN